MNTKEKPDNWLDIYPRFLEGVYREYYHLVLVEAMDITGDLARADEIVSRKFRTIYDMCGKEKLYFESKEAAFWYWAVSARNEAVKRERKKKTKTKFRLVPMKEEFLEDQSAEDERILAIMGSHMDFKREVRELLQELEEPDLQIVSLFIFENMSHKEIAARLGLDYAVTRQRYSRALARLEAKLDRMPEKKARLKDYLPLLLALLAAMPDQQ
jgi:RNA polymerase sigma factor (sigma-70 family)